MRCLSCAAPVPDDARFCSVCGEPVSSASQLPTGLASPSVEAAARRRGSPSSRVGRLASSESLDASGFAPGTLLSERYRIVGLVGRGGMGEVYRADDLKLGQPVALKFLPERFSSDRTLIERFYAEVRHSRQVSHPNVCRVYDVGEVDGHHFLSMEYVDGEDLASLLRRIGRLGGHRAVEIAREIVAGIAAAHDKGVLHRDLKPSNVMIDGRGRARITDFGLAVATEEDKGGLEVSGTPAYMAPEQLEGKGASVQSDLYALGLVLYELFTGRRAFDAATLAEWRQKHSQELPSAPSAHAHEIDPAVERTILRCLEKDPKARPRSAAAVAAALPGGNALAAAVAAGETPSPEMVAAAGESGSMKPTVALGFLAIILAGIALAAYLSPRAYLHGNVPLDKPPEALVERSKEIVRTFGYLEKPLGTAWGLSENTDYLRWVEEHDKSKDRWKDIAVGRPAAIYFWYRQSPAALIPERFRGGDAGNLVITESDPPPTKTGMIGVKLDTLGRLIRFEAVPSQELPPRPRTVDWATLSAEAGLAEGLFSPVEPRWLPPSFADSRGAWGESRPERPDRPLRVEASALLGRPVFFELAGPWSRAPRAPAFEPVKRRQALDVIGVIVLLALLVGGALIARHNLRLSRGDRRGATRLAAFVFISLMASWALDVRHVAGISELPLFLQGAGRSLFIAAAGWMAYIAIEPLIRRRWPDSLIAWTRLLSGRLTDPLVGRAILAGALLGTFAGVSNELEALVIRALEIPPPAPPYVWDLTLLGPRRLAGHLFSAPAFSMLITVGLALLFFLLRWLLKKDWLAALVFTLLYTGVYVLNGSWISAPFGIAIGVAAIFVFLRFGLLAWVFHGTFEHFLLFDLTTDSSAWYAGTSLFLALVLAGIAVYGFRIAVAGQPLFAGAALES